MSFMMRALSDALGAEVVGLDASRPIDDPTYIRHMHRTTIAGDVPF